MFGSALYYPSVDIHDGDWLRSAILFWDHIHTIVPKQIDKPYKRRASSICATEGYLSPLHPEDYPNSLNSLGERVKSLIQHSSSQRALPHLPMNDWNSSLAREAHNASSTLFQPSHLYPSKLSPELCELFISLGIAKLRDGREKDIPRLLLPKSRTQGSIEPSEIEIKRARAVVEKKAGGRARDTKWLLVDGRLSDLYMSALASALSSEAEVSCLSASAPAMTTQVEEMLDELSAPTAEADHAKGLLVDVVIRNLKIAPDTRVQNLLKFRRSRENQLIELAAAFDDLKLDIAKGENRRDMKKRAEKTYKKKVQPALSKLKTELRDQSILSVWEGFIRTSTVSVGAGSALAKYSGIAPTELLGVGALLTVIDIAVKTYYTRKRIRANNRYTYLMDVSRKFAAKGHA